LGVTRLNVYAGLAGFFMIRNHFPDHKPELPGLPFPPPGRGPNANVRELLLTIQDRAFDVNNQLYYPKQDALPAGTALPDGPVPPTWVPGEG
jgi:spore coat protein A